MTFVGIDVSKAGLEVAALSEDGEIQREKFGNHAQGHESLVVWLDRFPKAQVGLEATGTYHQRLSAVLQTQGIQLSVLNPAQVSYFVKSQQRRNKTDKADALWIAMYIKERQPIVTASRDLSRQSLAREIQGIAKEITRLKNRLEAAQHGQAHPKIQGSLERRITVLEEEKRMLEDELEQETNLQHNQQLELLLTIPGIGSRTACLLLAELGEVTRFSDARKLVAFAGLTPTQFESGSSVKKQSHISRLGSSHLRHILYMPCLAAIRFNPIIKAFFTSLVKRHKPKKVAVVACMAKLLKIIFGVLTHLKPFNPNLLTP
jgi:transposase